MLQSSAYRRYRAEAAHALSRLRHCQAQGDPAQVDRWHGAWSLAETAADAELREKGGGARVLRLKNPPPLRPLPEELTSLTLPPAPSAVAPVERAIDVPALDTNETSASSDPLARAVARHARIEQALLHGGPNPLPDTLSEGEWQEQLLAYQEGGPLDCELLQEAEATVEELVEMLPAFADEEEAFPAPTPLDTEPGEFERTVLPRCRRIYEESLADLTEEELHADRVTCLDAGRADTVALIERELRRREREEPPPPLPVREPEPLQKHAPPETACRERVGAVPHPAASQPEAPEPSEALAFVYRKTPPHASAAARGRRSSPSVEPVPEGEGEPAAPSYRTAPAWVDTAGRTRTWNLFDPAGEKLAEIATRRDAEKLAALLNRLLAPTAIPSA